MIADNSMDDNAQIVRLMRGHVVVLTKSLQSALSADAPMDCACCGALLEAGVAAALRRDVVVVSGVGGRTYSALVCAKRECRTDAPPSLDAVRRMLDAKVVHGVSILSTPPVLEPELARPMRRGCVLLDDVPVPNR